MASCWYPDSREWPLDGGSTVSLSLSIIILRLIQKTGNEIEGIDQTKQDKGGRRRNTEITEREERGREGGMKRERIRKEWKAGGRKVEGTRADTVQRRTAAHDDIHQIKTTISLYKASRKDSKAQ